MADFLGVDTSYAEGSAAMPAGVDFIVAKAGELDFQDSEWSRHYSEARSRGVPIFAYWFLRAERDPAAQADQLLSIAGSADGWAVDVERSPTAGTLPTQSQVRAFVARFQSHGRAIGLYQSELSPWDYPADSLGANWRWVANTSREPAVPWDMWQYAFGHPDLDRVRTANPALTAITSRAGVGGGVSGSTGNVEGTGSIGGGPDTAAIFRNAYVSGVRLSEAVNSVWPGAPWASAQGLTGNHLGTPPSVAAGTNYLAADLYALAIHIKSAWPGGNRSAIIAQPASVSAGDTNPTTATSPLYIAYVGNAQAIGGTAETPTWAKAQGLTGEHWGHPPDLQTACDWIAGALDALTTLATTGAQPPSGGPATGGGSSGSGAGSSGGGVSGSGDLPGGSGNTPPPPASGAGGGSTGQAIPPPPPLGPYVPGPGMTGLGGAWDRFGQLVGTTTVNAGNVISNGIKSAAR